ncbi:F-box/FBD/LRR-repeat protein At1g13570 [Eucalyptus grandis]|uniref:F-box/FBD/LRR-repeat protein At1g13570 n=1 Tax=Eucalyptus grandis TaxID=71139 RepID=UPI00192E9EB3|nr:F-box/FBD/LRR-repeat protein At1g13570 [Eucalyptus grandis]
MEKRMTQESDRISELPKHIAEEILSRLPIKQAGRTSVLSRKWRHKWRSIPRLVFDDQCTRKNVYGQPLQNLAKIIDRVLLLHTGPIQTFVLSDKGLSATRDIDHWILRLSEVSIKQIELCIYAPRKYKLPSCLFNCRDLTRLKLYGCSATIPPSFEGFKNLDTLYLERVGLPPNGIEFLISRCPLLKHLTLKNLEGITRVSVEAAHNLESLNVGGAFLDVAFGVRNHLESVTIGFDDIIGSDNANSSNLHKFFQHVPNIQILKIGNYSLKCWAFENVPPTLPRALVHLNYLSTCIDFNSKEQILTVICLIRSSPQLRNAVFQTQNSPKKQQTTGIATMADFWKDHHHQSCCLEQLQVVSMRTIFGTEPELEFMKFLLTSLLNLQKMIIRPNDRTIEVKLLRELVRFRRVSAQAEVIILNPPKSHCKSCY